MLEITEIRELKKCADEMARHFQAFSLAQKVMETIATAPEQIKNYETAITAKSKTLHDLNEAIEVAKANLKGLEDRFSEEVKAYRSKVAELQEKAKDEYDNVVLANAEAIKLEEEKTAATIADIKKRSAVAAQEAKTKIGKLEDNIERLVAEQERAQSKLEEVNEQLAALKQKIL